MSATTSFKRIGRAAWIAVRFVLFGCAGFCVMLFGAVAFIARVFEHDQDFMSPFLSLPLSLIGAIMMLYGTGEWGRWAYLWVFLSMPISLFLLLLLPDAAADKGSPALIVGVAAFATFAGVRAYYARRVSRARHEDDHAA